MNWRFGKISGSRRSFLKYSGSAVTALASGVALPRNAFSQPRLSGSVKIGILLPFSGPFALLGREQLNGAKTYVEMAGGSFDGMKVEFVQEDDQGDPAIALQKVQRLVESSNVDVTAGIVSSAVALAVRDYFNRHKRLLVISNASANAITAAQGRSRYIFRVSYSSWQNSYPLGPWAAKNVGKSAVLVGSNYAAGRELNAGFAEGFTKSGGKVTGEIFPPLGTTDFGPFLSGIKKQGAEFVYASPAGADALNFVKQYSQFGFKGSVPLIGCGSMTTKDVLDAEGEAAVGIHTNFPYTSTLDNPTNKAFVAAYRKNYNAAPSPFAAFGYDAIQLIHKALIATNGDKDIDKMIAAMEQVKFDSPRGPISFDPETHNVIQRQYLLEVQKRPDGLENSPISILGVFSDHAQIS
jgi:branched-chain amino acid transport system substrate-binding protein